jgi:membrane protease YdiL (CAAX protease family)
MSTQAITSTETLPELAVNAEREQYTPGQVLGLWALAAGPMALLAWVAAPALIPRSPLHPGITYWLLMIAGMAWQCVVSLAVLRRELGTLRWAAVRQRIWLQAPRDPRTGQADARLFWWLVPALGFAALAGIVLAPYLDAPMAWLFPGLQPPPFVDQSELASPAFRGQWWLLGVLLLSQLFNYFLGEELLFRGVLLPRMQGAFGRFDWAANAVLFGLYHLHKPWGIPTNIIGSLALTWPARRFRSNWMAIVVHGVEGLPGLVLVPAVILGLLPA